jgi:hypothetical protein
MTDPGGTPQDAELDPESSIVEATADVNQQAGRGGRPLPGGRGSEGNRRTTRHTCMDRRRISSSSRSRDQHQTAMGDLFRLPPLRFVICWLIRRLRAHGMLLVRGEISSCVWWPEHHRRKRRVTGGDGLAAGPPRWRGHRRSFARRAAGHNRRFRVLTSCSPCWSRSPSGRPALSSCDSGSPTANRARPMRSATSTAPGTTGLQQQHQDSLPAQPLKSRNIPQQWSIPSRSASGVPGGRRITNRALRGNSVMPPRPRHVSDRAHPSSSCGSRGRGSGRVLAPDSRPATFMILPLLPIPVG